MPTENQDLWPVDIAVTTAAAPVTVLRQQASALARRTNSLLEGNVRTQALSSGLFIHRFEVVVPAFDDYAYELFSIRHGVDLYPVETRSEGERVELQDEAQLVAWLRQVLASQRTKGVIAALLAQVTPMTREPIAQGS